MIIVQALLVYDGLKLLDMAMFPTQRWKVYMAVSYDTPDRPYPTKFGNGRVDPGFNVHSPFKQPIGARLARAGLKMIYNVSIENVAPRLESITTTAEGFLLKFSNLYNTSLELHSTRGFELLVNSTWCSTTINPKLSTSTMVFVNSGTCGNAKRIRYNWYDNPCGMNCYQCAIYAKVAPLGDYTGELPFLPLGPFVADIKDATP
eukprot:m.8650 g.8650  ORF g.8650 m.8650 type:complete len:204 (-) comp3935_c0_seq1:5-616(-)